MSVDSELDIKFEDSGLQGPKITENGFDIDVFYLLLLLLLSVHGVRESLFGDVVGIILGGGQMLRGMCGRTFGEIQWDLGG